MLWEATSILTGKTRIIFIPNLTAIAIERWQKGERIQSAMPDVTPEWREFVMNGITPAEWNDLCGGRGYYPLGEEK